ncbi:substrate-binding periplasmic protein [Bdellovibrio bacteriovorus]|uniref:Amino-acid ABC transporter binding protein n=1 Tax=Bdellovibrio bacteriovorus str. Tiberius TaxID=1069642 RepID=K7YKY7_BDEBC|nr:transporter substrate-binding domain-containing protein [Bdellovibrio bacteriovorus]AFY00401.1 amino-acid ABC transporter binding protein [Bdellovibrio bacteriovorus str. Tiberius]
MSAPWYFADSGASPKGITADYVRALANELGRKIDILVLPKFRIRENSQKNKIDLNCYTSREWAQVREADVFWSEPLFTSKNLIVSNTAGVKSLDQLKKQRIGTVLKYRYPALQDSFSAGTLLRDDSPNEDANLQKLDASRFNYAVVEEIHLAYYLKRHKSSKIQRRGLVIEEIPVRCWLRRDSPLKISELNRAIAQMKANGTMEKIFKKYR